MEFKNNNSCYNIICPRLTVDHCSYNLLPVALFLKLV